MHASCEITLLAIVLQLSLTDQDEVTPITLLSNGVLHLSGPARSVGAIVCGYSGIRTFEPQVRHVCCIHLPLSLRVCV